MAAPAAPIPAIVVDDEDAQFERERRSYNKVIESERISPDELKPTTK